MDNDQLFIIKNKKLQGKLCECCGALSSFVNFTVDCVAPERAILQIETQELDSRENKGKSITFCYGSFVINILLSY